VLRFFLLALLALLIARAFWRIVGGILETARSIEPGRGPRGSAPVKLVRDPVCGTFVSPRTALSATTAGRTHYFCSEECRAKFGRG
jgi:YHS domain-containing protein